MGTHLRQRHAESGFLTGTASIGHVFLRMGRLDARTAQPISEPVNYLEVAKAAGDYLLSIADHPKPGISR